MTHYSGQVVHSKSPYKYISEEYRQSAQPGADVLTLHESHNLHWKISDRDQFSSPVFTVVLGGMPKTEEILTMS